MPWRCVSFRSWVGAFGLVLAGLLPTGADAALAGIVQGPVMLIRHAERFSLAEGNALAEGDIVETGQGGFVQIEFDDQSSVNLGDSTRVLLGPRLARSKLRSPPQLYLLQGWLKATPVRAGGAAPSGEVPVRFIGPRLEVESRGGAVIAQFDGRAFALFCERGNCRCTPRDAPGAPIELVAGDFASQAAAGAARPVVAKRPSAGFLEQLPKLFRETLPLRASLFTGPRPPPKLVGAVDYGDVGHWLQAERDLRPPLVAEWRGRAADPAFKNELVAHLKSHPEWERILFPERFLPKPSPTPLPLAGPEAAAAPERAGSSP